MQNRPSTPNLENIDGKMLRVQKGQNIHGTFDRSAEQILQTLQRVVGVI